jgi:uncharacterized protein Veg
MAEVEDMQEKAKAKENKEKLTAETTRKKTTETLGETRRRSRTIDDADAVEDEEPDVVTPKRKRTQTNSMTDILTDAIESFRIEDDYEDEAVASFRTKKFQDFVVVKTKCI